MKQTSSFTKAVYQIVKDIPKGETLSYKEVAIRAGSPNAYRAVGSLLKYNYDPTIPCHRVIKSNGDYGDFNRGKQLKKELLEQEKQT